MAYTIASVLYFVLNIVCLWKIFTKAGYAGWKSLIPFLNIVVYLRVAKLPWFFILVFFIPIIGILIGMTVIKFRLGKAFGMGTGLIILSLFVPIMEHLCIAFNPYAEYDFE